MRPRKRPQITIPKPLMWDWDKLDAGQIRQRVEAARRAQQELESYVFALDKEFTEKLYEIKRAWPYALLQQMQELDRQAAAVEKERRFYSKRLKEVHAALDYIAERTRPQEQAA